MTDDLIPEDGYRTADLSLDKKFRQATLALVTTWRCAKCGARVSHPNPRQLRRQATAHAATHQEGS